MNPTFSFLCGTPAQGRTRTRLRHCSWQAVASPNFPQPAPYDIETKKVNNFNSLGLRKLFFCFGPPQTGRWVQLARWDYPGVEPGHLHISYIPSCLQILLKIFMVFVLENRICSFLLIRAIKLANFALHGTLESSLQTNGSSTGEMPMRRPPLGPLGELQATQKMIQRCNGHPNNQHVFQKAIIAVTQLHVFDVRYDRQSSAS